MRKNVLTSYKTQNGQFNSGELDCFASLLIVAEKTIERFFVRARSGGALRLLLAWAAW
jgi:hypothetical protein